MKSPWKDVKKCVENDQIANSNTLLSSLLSSIEIKFVIPRSGNNTTAALTAFLKNRLKKKHDINLQMFGFFLPFVYVDVIHHYVV